MKLMHYEINANDCAKTKMPQNECKCPPFEIVFSTSTCLCNNQLRNKVIVKEQFQQWYVGRVAANLNM